MLLLEYSQLLHHKIVWMLEEPQLPTRNIHSENFSALNFKKICVNDSNLGMVAASNIEYWRTPKCITD
jgi:hypothetical protein